MHMAIPNMYHEHSVAILTRGVLGQMHLRITNCLACAMKQTTMVKYFTRRMLHQRSCTCPRRLPDINTRNMRGGQSLISDFFNNCTYIKKCKQSTLMSHFRSSRRTLDHWSQTLMEEWLQIWTADIGDVPLVFMSDWRLCPRHK